MTERAVGLASAQDPRRVDPALRRRYDVRGPRYTSYPTAPHFGAIDASALHERWRARNDARPDPGLSLYVHLPFCRSRCAFCGCHTFGPQARATVDRYVDTLLQESDLAQRIISPGRLVRQLALGGGTPNYLRPEQLERLLTGLERRWSVAPDAERSVEIDTRSATAGTLDTFLAHGFNRFSLGVQDFDPAVLAHARRGADRMQVAEVVAHLRAAGNEAINFDLVYGLPEQTLGTAALTCERVLQLRPSRIALYSYAHVPWIHPHQEALAAAGLPDGDAKLALFLSMSDRFLQAGYRAVGMDHFALPDDPLVAALRAGSLRRSFMGYTPGRELDVLALGASAISAVGASYSQNVKELQPYLDAVQAGQLPLLRGFLLSPDDELRRALLLELFCTFRVDLEGLSRRFGLDVTAALRADLERLRPLERDGLVRIGPSTVEATDAGRFFIRNICMTFDRYLEQDPARRGYSRTV